MLIKTIKTITPFIKQYNKYLVHTVPKSLATLGLQTPITKKQIKSKYLKIAKQHHPDSSTKKESEKIFIQATQAYKYLNQLSQSQINNSQSNSQLYPTDNPTQERKMTKQQIRRAQTYQYFKSNYMHSKKYQNNQQSINESPRKKRIPLYKSVPQIFIGLFFVLLLFGQWGYHSFIRHKQISKQKLESDPIKFNNVFRSMSIKNKIDDQPHQNL